MGKGFLGTAASRAADLTLVIEIGMGPALVVGAVLARRRRYRGPMPGASQQSSCSTWR